MLITTEYINIRESPSTSSNKIGKVKSGETYEVISSYPGWYKIKIDDNKEGFIANISDGLTEIKE